MRIRPFKPFKLVRYSAHRSHNHTLRQTFAPPPLKAGRRFSPGLTILVLVAPVTSAFGCGYWLGNVIDNEKATLLEKDTSLEYGDEQAVQDVCQASEYVNCIDGCLRLANCRLWASYETALAKALFPPIPKNFIIMASLSGSQSTRHSFLLQSSIPEPLKKLA